MEFHIFWFALLHHALCVFYVRDGRVHKETIYFSRSLFKMDPVANRKRARSPSEQQASLLTQWRRYSGGVDPLVAHLVKAILPHMQKPNLELELRFCILCDDRNQRFRMPIETPAVVGRVKRADVSVSRQDFEKALGTLEEVMRCISAQPHEEEAEHRPMTKRETKTRDVVRSTGVRESFEPETGVSKGAIKKQRLVVCDILCPRSRYDIRLALNQEMPLAPSAMQSSSENNSEGGFVRFKQRTSYEAGVFSFDLTEVRQGHAPSAATLPSLEVEIEATLAPEVLGSADSLLPVVAELMGKGFFLLEKLS